MGSIPSSPLEHSVVVLSGSKTSLNTQRRETNISLLFFYTINIPRRGANLSTTVTYQDSVNEWVSFIQHSIKPLTISVLEYFGAD